VNEGPATGPAPAARHARAVRGRVAPLPGHRVGAHAVGPGHPPAPGPAAAPPPSAVTALRAAVRPGYLPPPAGGGPAWAPVPGRGTTTGQPPTLSLVLSRRARREAAATAAASAVPDRRLEVIEQVFTGFQVAGNVLALALSAVAWLWVATHHPVAPTAQDPGALAGDTGAATTGLAGSALLHPFAAISGTALVLIMLPACLLMAPSVNPFYAPPAERRRLHTSRTAVFALLAMSTVAVIAGAAG